MLALPAAGVAWGEDLAGLWWAEGGAGQVEISPCGDAFCGRVAWLRSPFGVDGCPLRDANNPDAHLRDRELLGIEVLSGLRASEERDAWEGGEIYDPSSGRTYRLKVRLEGPDRLDVRGYLAFEFLGRTTTWFRVGGEFQCSDPRRRAAEHGTSVASSE